MLIPIKCFTCGKVIANKWLKYKEMVEELEKNTDENEPEMKNFDKNMKGKILDKLDLKRICCRRHMLGHVDLIDSI